MTKMKNVRIKTPHKVIAFLLTWVILLTSLPYRRPEAAEGDGDHENGIGIYNHILTEQSGLQTEYKVSFYKTIATIVTPATDETEAVYSYEYKKYDLSEEYMLYDTSGNPVYLDSDGEIILDQGQAVDFADSQRNSSFRNFLIHNKITRIVIDVQCNETRDGEIVKAYEQYATTDGFRGNPAPYDSEETTTGDPADEENIKPSREIYKLQYVTDDNDVVTLVESSTNPYKIAQYNLTPMVDCDVHVNWRDTNADRPAKDIIQFDITRNVDEQDPQDYIQNDVYVGTDPAEDAVRTITDVDSNHILYSYSVPECAEDGNLYTYTASQHEVSGYFTYKNGTPNYFTNYNLTDFSCNINWGDTAHPEIHEQLESATDAVRAEFIRSHFELVDETIDGHFYNVLNVSENTLNESWFPSETKKYIQETYDKVDDLTISKDDFNNLGLPDGIKELITQSCAESETNYQITDNALNSIDFTDVLKTIVYNEHEPVVEEGTTYYKLTAAEIDALKLPQSVKDLILAKAVQDGDDYKVSDAILSAPEFSQAIREIVMRISAVSYRYV